MSSHVLEELGLVEANMRTRHCMFGTAKDHGS